MQKNCCTHGVINLVQIWIPFKHTLPKTAADIKWRPIRKKRRGCVNKSLNILSIKAEIKTHQLEKIFKYKKKVKLPEEP